MRVNMSYGYQLVQSAYASQAYNSERLRRIRQKCLRVESIKPTKDRGLEYQIGHFLDLRA